MPTVEISSVKWKKEAMKIYRYPSKAAQNRIAAIVNRGLGFRKKDLTAVSRILDDVKKHGDTALIKYTQRFDAPGLKAASLKVSDRELKDATKKVDRAFTRALNRAASQIEDFHRLQYPKSWINTQRPGTLLGQLVNPVDAAGVYVPGGIGGETPLVSSVLMGVIPARIAGVRRIVMVTPPTRKAKINPHLLVAAQKAGVDAIYKVGSAWPLPPWHTGLKRFLELTLLSALEISMSPLLKSSWRGLSASI